MELRVTQGGIVRLPEGLTHLQLDQVRTLLTYNDSGKNYEYLRFKRFGARYCRTAEEFKAKADALKNQVKQNILFKDEEGFWTYSGLAQTIADVLKIPVVSEVVYSKAQGMNWNQDKTHWPFQVEAAQKLIEAKHGGVSIGTGLGKSTIIAMLVKHFGLLTVVMTPSTSISEQLYEEFVTLFGKKLVGRLYDGHKDVNRQIVIANGQSLTRIEPDSEIGQILSNAEVFIADESHQTPAATFEKVCLGLFINTPYRFFFSATQLRGDGKGIVLDGITGPIVYDKTVKE